MNLFTTDHPLVTERSPAKRRFRKCPAATLVGYPLYLLLLGPYWAMDGRGLLDFIPSNVREACYWPSAPLWAIPHLRGRLADYLDWWYLDPSAPDRETGWD